MANYATQYARSLSQAYPNVLHFGALFARNQEADYRFVNNHTIEIPSISVTGRVDGSRTAMIARTQRHSNSWTPLTLRNHRSWNDFIHPRDIDETNQVLSIQNITRTMNEQEKFPEKDKYLISTFFSDWSTAGRVPFTGNPTTSTILTFFDDMMVDATEKNVPATGRILYVTPQINVILKGASAFYRNLNMNGGAPANIQRAIANLDQVAIEEVPSDHMQTVYDFTVGAVKGASAKQVLMFMIHPSCIITPETYDFAQLDPPSAGSQGKYEYFEESFEDVFLLPNKQYGADFLVAGLEIGTCTFTSAAGTNSGDTKLTITAPTSANTLTGSRYFYATASSTPPTALTYGQNAANNTGWTEWDGESDVTATNGYKMTMLVTDAIGRVYYAGNATVVSKT
ncbi:MAG: capsid protein [Clostridia bacterium]